MPKFSVEGLFGYLHTHNLEPAIGILRSLLPDIVDAYKSMLLKNFSKLADRFEFFKFVDAPMLVEVTRNPFGGYSDFITLGYIILPSITPQEKCLVYTCAGRDSIAHVPLIRKTLVGVETWRGGRFGHASISRQIGELRIEEPNATIYFTRFPSHLPVLDQVYQLLGSEAAYVLGGDSGEWHNLETGRTDDNQLNWWISRHYGQQGPPPTEGASHYLKPWLTQDIQSSPQNLNENGHSSGGKNGASR
jgi:hypothetical protein